MSNKLIKLISMVYIIGGLLQIIYVFYKYFNDQVSNHILLMYLIFFGFAVLSGLLFFINEKLGTYFLLANSILQIGAFNIGSVAFLYSVLFSTIVYVDNEFTLRFYQQLGGVISVGYFPDREYIFEIGINVHPIFFTGVLLNYIRKTLSSEGLKAFSKAGENK